MGRCERALHVRLRKIASEAEVKGWNADRVRRSRNDLKRDFLVRHGLTGRQYNSLLRGLEGRYRSLRELAGLRAEKDRSRLATLEKKIKARQKKLDSFDAVSSAVAERAAIGKGPTKAQAKKLMSRVDYDKARFAQHNQKRRAETLRQRIDKEIALSKMAVPPVVFGSKALLRKRPGIHPNDIAGLAQWRTTWDKARSAQFLCIGSKNETAGCQTCVATYCTDDVIDLRLRLPPALTAEGKHLRVEGISLPNFGRKEILAALKAHCDGSEDRSSIAWRFVRDPDWPAGNTLSAWTVFITLDIALPEISQPIFETSGTGKYRDLSRGMRSGGEMIGALGVDLNADHLAWCAIDRFGNPVKQKSGRIDLPLRGKTSDQRRALIGDACARIVEIAEQWHLPVVVEQLDFRKKQQEVSADGTAGYARMLSSLAYARILTILRRRAERAGIELVEVNPAYTSVIGRTNYARRYGLSTHIAAAAAIARRAARFSERVNYVYGYRGRRGTLRTRSESRKHVWTEWQRVRRERAASRTPHTQRHAAHDLPSAAPIKKGDGEMSCKRRMSCPDKGFRTRA